MAYTVPGVLQARILGRFPSPGDLPNPGIEPKSSALQTDSLPTEPSGKPLSLHYCLDGMCVCEVAQSCPTLCDPMDCSLTGSSVHGIFQARVLEWVAISFSRGSSPPRNRTPVSRIAGRCFTVWATRNSGGMLYGNSASLRETRQIVLFLTTVCESTIKSVKILLDETKQCMCCLQMHDGFFWAGWGHVEKIRFRRDRKGLQILFFSP